MSFTRFMKGKKKLVIVEATLGKLSVIFDRDEEAESYMLNSFLLQSAL